MGRLCQRSQADNVRITKQLPRIISNYYVRSLMPPHPNVVQVFGISRNGPHPVLILEYCDGGSLDRMLYESSIAFSADQTLEIVYGMAKGMYHLHKNNIVHRDLAARNILVSRSIKDIYRHICSLFTVISWSS